MVFLIGHNEPAERYNDIFFLDRSRVDRDRRVEHFRRSLPSSFNPSCSKVRVGQKRLIPPHPVIPQPCISSQPNPTIERAAAFPSFSKHKVTVWVRLKWEVTVHQSLSG